MTAAYGIGLSWAGVLFFYLRSRIVMDGGVVVEVEVGDSKQLLDYRPFYEGVLRGVRGLLFLDKTNPAYLVTKLWTAGPEFIEPYSVAIKERVAVNGNMYKGAARRTFSEAKKIRDANQLMCSLCIVDEQSKDLFMELFEYALCKFISDCEKQNLPLRLSSVATVVEGFMEFFSKRPVYMSINAIKGVGAIRVGAPKEGYLEGDPGGPCVRFHSVFFRFKREIPQKKETSTTMLLLFLSSLVDFFSVLLVSRDGLFKRGGAKVSYEGLRIMECGVPTNDAYAAECKKEKMLYIANEFLAGSKAGRWSFDLGCVEFLTEEELAYLPRRAAGSGVGETTKYPAQLCPGESFYEGRGVSVGGVCSGVCEQPKLLPEMVSAGRSAVLPLEGDLPSLGGSDSVVLGSVAVASIFEDVPGALEESTVAESASVFVKHA